MMVGVDLQALLRSSTANATLERHVPLRVHNPLKDAVWDHEQHSDVPRWLQAVQALIPFTSLP
jgi:hypothetical protein